MDLIILDDNFNEVKILDKFSLDIDLAGDKSFSILTSRKDSLDFEIGWAWYIPGTEYGGIVDEITVKTDSSRNNTVEYSGRSWRGWLDEYIYSDRKIEIAAGQTYESALLYVFSMTGILDDYELGHRETEIVGVDDDYKMLTVTEKYASDLYPTLYEFLIDFADSLNANLRLELKKSGSCMLKIGFVEKKTISSEEFTADNTMYFEAIKRSSGINHLVCLGSGEYPTRTIIHLYVDDRGEISTTSHYMGKESRTAIYDYPNAESQDELKESGIEHLKELMTVSEMTVSIDGNSLNIGDKVKCFDELTGLNFESEISSVIFKLETHASGASSSVEYVIKEEV